MDQQSDMRYVAFLHGLARTTRVVVILVGGLVLIGWAFNIALLKSVVPGATSMKANTALSFLLAGLAMQFLQSGPAQRRTRRLGYLLIGVIIAIAVLTLSEYLFGWDLGLDQWLFRERVVLPPTPYPGRMAALTAVGFLLSGAALLLQDT